MNPWETDAEPEGFAALAAAGWPASRAAALARLHAFADRAGRAYAARRNFDWGPGRHTAVSGLSPYVRPRLIAEEELAAAALARHGWVAAEKFVQEVCWRTYWKGWLEQHPGVWAAYRAQCAEAESRRAADRAFARRLARAEAGETGLEAFDVWARELAETGYLHNHARMWFASVWIFTLGLPWVLGAELFLRRLLDGDPASNTLSWRWVAGLHTRGKTYLARADNIAAYTEGRLHPSAGQLAATAPPLDEVAAPVRGPLPKGDATPGGRRILWLVTEEDLTPELWALDPARAVGAALLAPQPCPGEGEIVSRFRADALADARARLAAIPGLSPVSIRSARELADLAHARGAEALATPYIPVGPTRDRLADWAPVLEAAGLSLAQVQRPWDQAFWPHARAGFFQLKARMPKVLGELDLL
ncbi:MAG: hypothetical protein KGL69_09600 [Alphaproteobacteria bacterium]|nr:hypothetical protein [Alphaproteobacteria bacterium]